MSAISGAGVATLQTSSPPPPTLALPPDAHRALAIPAMGGSVRILVSTESVAVERADRDLALVGSRILAWAARLTRFDLDSDLSALNRDPRRPGCPVRPTLAAALACARALDERTEGTVDVTLLGARKAAEAGAWVTRRRGSWWLERAARHVVVHRDGHVVFDLDGVGKGWIADRALGLLDAYPSAFVDADGDIALRLAAGRRWEIGVADPRRTDSDLATITIPEWAANGGLGIATSGTSVHRWQHSGGTTHHLIDPRTSRPAVTDVLQATVVAESAVVAEGLAKSVVIRGSEDGLDLLERAGAYAELLLLEDGEVLSTPRSLGWLA